MNTDFEQHIPLQRATIISAEKAEYTMLAKAAAEIIAGNIVLFENGPVMALAADANNPDLQQKISDIKKDRSPNQPLGWIAPFNHAMPAVDLSVVTDSRLLKFLENNDNMTRRLGALSFVRARANMAYKRDFNIPNALIPESTPETPSTVQLFSPTTNERCSRLVRYVMAHGVRIAMTSANYHGQNEIVTYEEAAAFAKKEGDLLFSPQYLPSSKPVRPRGSYSVISVLPDRLCLIRYGFMDPQIMKDILYDVPLEIKPGLAGQQPKHPDNVLRRQDLKVSDRRLKGSDLHDAVIETIA